MNNSLQKIRWSGFSVVEVIVAAAVFVAALTAFVASFEYLGRLSADTEDRAQAALLLEEGAEAMLLLRDEGFDDNIAALTTGQPYALYWDGSAYRTSASEVLIAGRYHRAVTVFPVYRDGTGSLAHAGAVDPTTRRARLEVSRDGEVLASSEMLIHDSYE